MRARHPETAREMVKVNFRLPRATWHRLSGETLWAERIDDRRVRLSNIPFFAYGVSFNDVVFAKPRRGILTFESVSIHSGHSTYRLFENEGVSPEVLRERWQALEDLACGCELGMAGVRAVDVPSSADLREVYALFEQGERDGIWDFEEGHCGHPFNPSETHADTRGV